jgi:lysozyme
MIRMINAAGLALIKQYEQGPYGGPALVAYRDPSGAWTVGWGHTSGVYEGDTITAAQADYLLALDLASSEACVNTNTVPAQTSDNQFAAMVSLTFNIGQAGFLGSSVRRLHNEQNFPAAANAFLLWDKATIDGRLIALPGLLNRREAERALYLTPASAGPSNMTVPLVLALAA